MMQKEGHPFTKKQLGIIFKIAFLEAMALSLVVPSVTSSGEIITGCVNNVCSDVQSGSITLTISGHQVTTSGTVNFNPIFTSTPKVLTQITSGFVNPEVGTEITIQAGGSSVSTWTTMPNAITEIYGNTNNEFGAEASSLFDCILLVNVVTAGTATAILRVQYTPDGGSTWLSFLAPDANADVNIGSIGLQVSGAPSSIVSTAADLGTVQLRLAGMNGNGIVSPQFGLIELVCRSEPGNLAPVVVSPISTSSMTIIANIAFPIGPSQGTSITIKWTACTIGC